MRDDYELYRKIKSTLTILQASRMELVIERDRPTIKKDGVGPSFGAKFNRRNF